MMADHFGRGTCRVEYEMPKYFQIMTQRRAAELLRLPTSTLSELLQRAIT
jgi:hypothetical protein